MFQIMRAPPTCLKNLVLAISLRLTGVLLVVVCTASGALAQTRIPFQVISQFFNPVPAGFSSISKYINLPGGEGFITLSDYTCSGCTYIADTVPSNRRAVIEQVSVRFKTPVGQMGEVILNTSVKVPTTTGSVITSVGTFSFTPVNKVSGAKDWFSMVAQTKIYASPGTYIVWTFNRSDSTGSVEALSITISGYYEDATVAGSY